MQEDNKLWIGTSWKMNKTLAEALHFAKAVKLAESYDRIQRFIIPPFTAVREVKALLAESDVRVGAQNMHWDEAGAWTGEVSASMLVDCQLDLVELGHSERRTHFSEDDCTVGLKVEAATRHALVPLICIGETWEQRESGNATQALADQVRGSLLRIQDIRPVPPVLFAYEPVWAIGDKGKPATADYADERQREIIELASDMLGMRVQCLYGGSVNEGNCAELIVCEHIDGLFIGRSAWNVQGYLNILDRCNAVLEGV